MFLIFTSGQRGRPAVDIDRVRLTIGRVAENDVQLIDDKVSRHHAVIELQDGGRVVLRDLDSRNGNFVNGVRLSGSCVLTGGEQLRFGDEELRVEAGPANAAVQPSGDASVGADTQGQAAAPAHRPARRRILPGRVDRRGVALAVLALAAILVVGVAQLVLPGVAEEKVRSDLSRYGPVRRVHIESTPAIQLLWHRADRVDVAMDSYRSEPGGHGSLADFLSRTRDTGKLDVSVGTLQTQLLTLHDVRLHKEGDTLVGQARLTQHDLSAALPTFLDLRPVSASEDGIVARVSASVLGHQIAARIRVLAEGGRVLVRPEGFPFGSLATITVFDDPRVYVESLGAELRGGDYLLTARARLK
jgi:pSer/pThr/pTyr-binding forkhead associated (FHA) protein